MKQLAQIKEEKGFMMAPADATQTAMKYLFQSTIYGGKTIMKYPTSAKNTRLI